MTICQFARNEHWRLLNRNGGPKLERDFGKVAAPIARGRRKQATLGRSRSDLIPSRIGRLAARGWPLHGGGTLPTSAIYEDKAMPCPHYQWAA